MKIQKKQAIGENLLYVMVWAAIILGFTLLGLGSLLLGLIAVMPMLGHASWHAYRDLVDADSLPAWDAGVPVPPSKGVAP